MDPVDAVRETCAWVAARATHVRIDGPALARFAAGLAEQHRTAEGGGLALPEWDAGGWHYAADAAAGGPLTAQYVLVLDALNWCFWPSPTGLEYDALAIGLREALEADPHAFDADRLAAATPELVAGWVKAPHVLPNVSAASCRAARHGHRRAQPRG